MRKEVNLESKIVERLEKLATKDKRKLKPYMEKILIEHSETAVRQKKKN